MAQFGVTADGFVLKGLDAILADSLARARQMFGADVDLTPTSPLRMILEVVAAEDAELWKRMEDLYYSNFISSASGDNLELLGEDLGLARRQLFAEGRVRFTIANPAPGRVYTLPEGTVVVTAAPIRAFGTTAAATLSASTPTAELTVRAFERGPSGDLGANQIVGVDPTYRQIYLDLGAASLSVVNDGPFTGGLGTESDEEYRARLLGLPRNLWTLESVRRAVLEVDGVVDVALSDPQGGVDASQSFFDLFNFGERTFSGERRLGEPYFFDVVVAHEPGWPFRTQGPVEGVFERVAAAVERVRPIGIYPNIVRAEHVEVGVAARVIVEPGFDQQVLLASIKARLATDIGALKLGGDVLFSQVMRVFVEQSGVVDVQNLRLRRCQPVVEAAVGENLTVGPREIAVFRFDSELVDLELVGR